MAGRIRQSIKYIAELFETISWSPRLATADNVIGREFNIYHFSIADLIQPNGLGKSDEELYLSFYDDDDMGHDDSGNGNDGTAADVTQVTGPFGKAGSYNGSTSKIDLDSTYVVTAGNDFTICGWLNVTAWYVDGVNQTASICRGDSSASSYNNHITYFKNAPVFQIEDNSGNKINFSGVDLSLSTNYFFLIEFKTAETNLYINGTKYTVATVLTDDMDIDVIGKGYGKWSLDGVIAEIRIYDRTLSAAERTNLYLYNTIPQENYWIEWGGTFDNPTGYGLQIFMNQYLVEVFDQTSLESTSNSFWIDKDNDKCYMNLPKKPWQYISAIAKLYDNKQSTFSTGPKDENNLSDIIYDGIKVLPRMEVPSVKNEINDIISGISTYNDFNILISNQDGKFDGFDILKYFNRPLQISKTSENDQSIEDFNRIRFGIVSNISVEFDALEIEAADEFYLMNNDFCNKFTLADYPNIASGDINKDIPVSWGPVSNVPLIEVNKDTADPATWIDYIAIDKDYLTDVDKIYDDDGTELTFTFSLVTGIIRTTSVDGDGEAIEAESADVVGKSSNLLGEVVIESLSDNENMPYVDGIWDVTETDKYLAICADVGFYFDGGITRDLVEGVLESDNAFLIQKNNGLFTLRQWGQEYETHYIPSEAVTQKPGKNFEDAFSYFCSSVKILFDKNFNDDNFLGTYIDDTREFEIFEDTTRSFLASFETSLINENEITDLAERLLSRFGEPRETLDIGVGVDTFDINPLDTVKYEGMINDRDFSDYSRWIVKSVNPGQDQITMEGLYIGSVLTFDGVDATLDNDLLEVN